MVQRRREAKLTTGNGASGDGARRVIHFRPRTGRYSPAPQPGHDVGWDAHSPVADLAQYERTGEQDNYRHRMIVNAVALAFTVVLAAAGIWIAESMAVMRKNQDCVLMGRRGCGVVVAPTTDRWSGSVTDQRR